MKIIVTLNCKSLDLQVLSRLYFSSFHDLSWIDKLRCLYFVMYCGFAHFCSSELTKLSFLLRNQVKEKTIAARRSEVRTIIFPSANRRDFDELAANVKEGLEVHFVDDYSQIFDLALGYDQDAGI